MKKRIMHPYYHNYVTEKMFLGTDLNLQRYDQFKYDFFYSSYQKQIGAFWRPEKNNLIKDRSDFLDLSDVEQDIFTKVLQYQIILDSSTSRMIPYLTHYVSLPEVELAFKTWEFFETIHSYSYTYIIQNVYPDANVIFDEIMKIPEIISRAKKTTMEWDRLLDKNETDIEKIKDNIYLSLISANILEGIRFYISFACSYAFAESKRMEGNAKIIAEINRDENMHLSMTQNILKILHTEESEGFIHVAERNRDRAVEMYHEALQQEEEWADYLFRNGSIIGLTETLLKQYARWLTGRRMKTIGLPGAPENTKNPFTWIESWTNSEIVQVAPQETESETYRTLSFVNDIDNVFSV